jgi:hypothetical protein
MSAVQSSVSSTILVDQIKTAYSSDPVTAKMLQGKCELPFAVKSGLIVRAASNRIYVPNNKAIKTLILHECHDSPIAGHGGIARTTEMIQRCYYWPRMHRDVENYVTSCYSCQTNKAQNQLPNGPLHPLPIPERRWDQVTMDLITQLPVTSQGHDAIVVWVDKVSKMVICAATTTSVTAPVLAQLMYKEVVRHYGIPRSIVSDRDPRFTSKVWTCLWEMTGTKLNMSTAYHPQSDGQTERANRTLEQYLRAHVNYHQDDWDKYLVSAELAFNSGVQASTGFTPFYLNYGQEINLPLDHNIPSTTR